MADERAGNAAEHLDVTTPLAWSVRPCERNWPLAILVVVLIVALSLAVQLYFGGPVWALLALVLLGLSVLPHYTRTRYELNDEGVTMRGAFATYRRAWPEIKGCFPDPDGVLLSPLSSRSRLAYTRGIYVRFGGNKDEVTARVTAYIERSAGGSDDAAGDAGTD
ncbi:MAG TPA: hypothetical protein QGH10_27125 [Armatimonadota bacterium]|nr:hypothetical protein [Armatimonadota bacterium]